MLVEGISQEVPGTSKEIHDLELQECSYVTRGNIPGNPKTSLTWDYRNVATLLEGISQEVPQTSQDTSEYVRNTMTSDGSCRYLWYSAYTAADHRENPHWSRRNNGGR